jgi:3'-phosphoadenosine 5'-phosphosulfate sulfotransferase (PAPS reductase)/FAD synthetase
MSGGKDSTATALVAMDMGYDFVGAFADTGNEHEITYEYIDYLERKLKIKIHKVESNFETKLQERLENFSLGKYEFKNENAPKALKKALKEKNKFLNLCCYKHMFPSRMSQFCTEYLKRIPITLLQDELGNKYKKPVCSWQGVRWDESESRSKLPYFDNSNDWIEIYRPILHLKREDVFDIHKRFGIKRNPLYDMGFTRVGCFPCINSPKNEILLINELFPGHIEKIAKWEKLIKNISPNERATFFHLNKKRHLVKGFTVYDYIEYCKTKNKSGRPRKNYDFYFCNASEGVCE